ncbi:hypothetical protein, partial [Paenibacillus sp. UNC217MF]|uniref:hypothetical protein n=1 Tax=Paenibacillus sp. UNC217MF TaxID=1449062 RepID=UPI0018CC5A03
DLPNRFRVQDIDPVLFDHQIIDIKQYNAWEDQHLTPQQKNDIANLIYERFKDDTDLAIQNYFYVVEHTSEGVDALAGAIGARAVRSRNSQPPIKPQGISKGSNIRGIKVSWGQAKTFINDRFEALQKSVGQLPKNKLAYDGPNVNYKSSTQKPLEPTKNQIEVRKYYSGTEPENSASGSASCKVKKASGEGTKKLDESNRLNVGAGDNPRPGYRNGDINPRAEGVEVMDANNLVGIKTGSQAEVIVQNPHGYNALEGDIPRVIEPGGSLKIVGGEKKTYFSKIYKMNDEELSRYGFRLVNKGKASDDLMFGTQKTTSGDAFSEKALSKQLEVILRRLK